MQPLDLQQVQADELRVKLQGRQVFWVAMAIMVSTRLWLGAVISARRDSHLIAQLAAGVRRWAHQVALFITFDGLAAYRDAFEQAFSDKRRPPTGGRATRCVWPLLTLAQVVKHTSKGAFHIARYVLRGSCSMLVRLRALSQGDGTINTAFIERLNGTFRMCLAILLRRTHNLARTQTTLTHAVFLLGAVYNFCRPLTSLGGVTPAMAAGLTDHRWSVSDLLWHRPTVPSLPSTV